MVVSNEPKLIICETDVIYKPKPKKLYKSNLKLSPLNNLTRSSNENQKHARKNKKKRENWNLDLKKDNNLSEVTL